MNAQSQEVIRSTPRSFGLVMASFFSILALWPLLKGQDLRTGFLIIAAIFGGIAVAVPSVLQPLNVAWARFGLLLNKVVSPVVLGLLFFTTVTPIALIMRATGKDILGLRFQSGTTTYWKPREAPRPAQQTMKEQF